MEETPRALVERIFADAPIMIEVARCESGFRQYATSTVVLRGRQNPKDVGIFQVNEFYHLRDATKMMINIYTPEGNVKYARWLYDHQGTTPWNWSKPCWGKKDQT